MQLCRVSHMEVLLLGIRSGWDSAAIQDHLQHYTSLHSHLNQANITRAKWTNYYRVELRLDTATIVPCHNADMVAMVPYNIEVQNND